MLAEADASAPYCQGSRSLWLLCSRSTGWKVPNCTQRAYRSSGSFVVVCVPPPSVYVSEPLRPVVSLWPPMSWVTLAVPVAADSAGVYPTSNFRVPPQVEEVSPVKWTVVRLSAQGPVGTAC